MAEQSIRPELAALPARLKRLPLDRRGYPVPWFVAWQNGEPEFRATDGEKWARAVRERLCWVCGGHLGVHLSFVIGPMCALNRTISEPPSHHECAVWSALNCPFLSRPQMVRREDDVINDERLTQESAGCAITRNPGVACVWTTRSYTVFKSPRGGSSNRGYLITIGDPERVEWFARGREATRDEVAASIDSGLPLLHEAAALEETRGRQTAALEEIARRRSAVEVLFPAA